MKKSLRELWEEPLKILLEESYLEKKIMKESRNELQNDPGKIS